MDITVLYNRDLYANAALNCLLPALSDHAVTLFHSTKIGGGAVSGAPSLSTLRAFESTLLPADCRYREHPCGITGSGRSLLSFNDLGRCYGLSDEALDHVNTADGIGALAGATPDIILSIRFGKILRQPAIDIPRFGVLNLHSGPLPDYRGVMPTFWGMLAGEEMTGMTLHWISDASIDTGATIRRTTDTLDYGASYVWNVWRLYEAGVNAMLSAVADLAGGGLSPPDTAADSGKTVGSYFSFPLEEDIARFLARGLVLFDELTRERILAAKVGI